MGQKEIVELIDSSGNKIEVEVVTYLVSQDKLKRYVVYTKDEVRGEANNHVIYISKLYKENDSYKIEEITNDDEWKDVQLLLKQIANAE